jgi:hypothetical protein
LYLEREDEVAEKMRTMSEIEAREAAWGMFGIVRSGVRRFMTLVSDEPGAGSGTPARAAGEWAT